MTPILRDLSEHTFASRVSRIDSNRSGGRTRPSRLPANSEKSARDRRAAAAQRQSAAVRSAHRPPDPNPSTWKDADMTNHLTARYRARDGTEHRVLARRTPEGAGRCSTATASIRGSSKR
jgi:SRSO17 transposase